MGNRRAGATGGSGACFKGIVRLSEGNYNVIVGSGGLGYSRDINTTPPAGLSGSATTLRKDGVLLVSAGGGSGANSWQSGANAGIGGTLNTEGLDIVSSEISSNGNNGYGSLDSWGTQSPYSGHSYGNGGGCQASYGGGTARPSYNGYFFLKFKELEDEYSLYKGSQKIRYVYKGGYSIKKIYKGNTLVFVRVKYNEDDVIYSSPSPVNVSLKIENDGLYELIAVGGGGAGSGSGGGGKGSNWYPNIDITPINGM